jgi:hypothetical protein
MTLVPVLLLALLIVAGCTGSDDADPTPATVTSVTSVTTSTTTTSVTSPTVTSSPSPSSSTPSGSTAASTVHTDGGDVTVRARDGSLELVEIVAAAGWAGKHRLDDATHLVVSFRRDGDRVDVTVELTPTGIRTATRSTSGG